MTTNSTFSSNNSKQIIIIWFIDYFQRKSFRKKSFTVKLFFYIWLSVVLFDRFHSEIYQSIHTHNQSKTSLSFTVKPTSVVRARTIFNLFDIILQYLIDFTVKSINRYTRTISQRHHWVSQWNQQVSIQHEQYSIFLILIYNIRLISQWN